MSAAAKVLERARAADVRLAVCGRRLAYDAPANVSPDLLAQLRDRKVEILELLQHERRELSNLATDPRARTRCLSALIGTLSPSRVPHHWPAAIWPQFIADAQAFCRDWAERGFLSGWTAWELFGCHRRAPWGRIQGTGLVVLLRGREIAALTATEAGIRTSTGLTRPTAGSPLTRSILLNAVSCGSFKMNAEQFLEHAGGLVNRRRTEYGEPIDLFERVAVRWSQVLGTRVSPAQVIICLVDLKLARLAHDPRHLDSITDVAGYAGCLAEVLSDA